MRNFIRRAVDRISKLDQDQVLNLINILTDENELLEIVLDSMTDGVIVSDKEENLLFINKSAKRLLRTQYLNENVENSLWDAVPDRKLREILLESINSNDDKTVNNFIDNYDNDSKILEFTTSPLVKEKCIYGNIIMIKDITERKIRETKLRRAESLASLTTLAAGVAHEIKNPLGSISIYLQLIEKLISKKEKDPVSEKIIANISVINEEVERLNKIVVDFLFAVRPINLDLEYNDLNKIVNETLEFMKVEFDDADIKVVKELSEDLPEIMLDSRFVKQALINLLKNAEAAMKGRKGVLEIKTGLKDSKILLEIKDNGTGIPDRIIGRIFEPYFTTKDFGSGIGLTLVYKIIKEHKGDITISSSEGKGTSFTLSFPAHRKEQKLLSWEGGNSGIFDTCC